MPASYGLPLWEALHGRRREVRHHALRHRGDARAARREGLHHRRPGDRRHGDARRSRHGLDRSPGRSRTSSASARSPAPTCASAGAQAAGRPAAGRPATRCSRRARRSSADPAAGGADDHARPRHLELLQPEPRPLLRARAGRGRPRPDRPEAVRAADRPDARGDRHRARVLRSRREPGCMAERAVAASRRWRRSGCGRAASGSASARASARSTCAASRAIARS